MPEERSQRIELLYHAARERSPGERGDFLEQACAGDSALRREVESLLAEDTGVQSFLETPALDLARKMSDDKAGRSIIGRQIGSYSIVSLLAKGGMGAVYCARDTRLGRDVAVKILPAAFARDAERLARFRREARLLAALNHPHIAAIYGMEESDGLHCLVMELVPGETLAGAGPLPLEKAGEYQSHARGRCEDPGFRSGQGTGVGALGTRSFGIADGARGGDRRRTKY